MRYVLEMPWLKRDPEGERRIREQQSTYEFKPGVQMLPDAIDIQRSQKVIDKIVASQGGDPTQMLKLMEELGMGRLLFGDDFTAAISDGNKQRLSLGELARRIPELGCPVWALAP